MIPEKLETETEKKAKKLHILQDVTVEADLSGMLSRWYSQKTEDYAKQLERAVKDFETFLRDHRSQDMVRLSVNRIFADVCSICNEKWETQTEDGKTFCANCGADIEE